MPRRLLLAGVAVLGLSACGPALYDFPTESGTARTCRTLVDDLPGQVLDQEATPVDSERVAAWGDPRVVLRCGVKPPAALRPTSRCDDVNGVGWFTQKREGGGRLFTTIGRDPDVSVEVPGGLEPAGAALIDLAEAVKGGTKAVQPCV